MFVENLDGLFSLESIMLQGNLIASLDDVGYLSRLPSLKTLYLRNLQGSESNPVCDNLRYRSAVLKLLSGLVNLDGERVRVQKDVCLFCTVVMHRSLTPLFVSLFFLSCSFVQYGVDSMSIAAPLPTTKAAAAAAAEEPITGLLPPTRPWLEGVLLAFC